MALITQWFKVIIYNFLYILLSREYRVKEVLSEGSDFHGTWL